jgi:hypothetical protein
MLSECKGTFGLGSHKWYINRIDSGTDLGGCVDYFAGKTCRPAKMSAMQRDIKCIISIQRFRHHLFISFDVMYKEKNNNNSVPNEEN